MPGAATAIVEPFQTGSTVEALLAADVFRPYRYYPVFTLENDVAVRRLRLERALRSEGVVARLVRRNGVVCAFVVAEQQTLGTEIFAVNMWTVRDAGCLPEVKENVRRDLLEGVCQSCAARGGQHISIRLDAADTLGVRAACGAGFVLVDTLITYAQRCSRIVPKRRKMGFDVHAARPEERAPAVDLARHAFAMDRFHADPWFDNARADEFYATWTDNVFDGHMADHVWVATRNNVFVGFCSYLFDRDVHAATGLKMIGEGIGGACPEHKGAFPAVMAHLVANGLDNDLINMETQLAGIEANRIYQWLGFNVVRARQTFHKWIGAT
jgi:hypothetical protein